jgi:hypothetical protein
MTPGTPGFAIVLNVVCPTCGHSHRLEKTDDWYQTTSIICHGCELPMSVTRGRSSARRTGAAFVWVFQRPRAWAVRGL